MTYITYLRIAPIACAALLQGCFGGGGNDDNDPNAQTLSQVGSYEICSHEDNLDNDGYASARMSYPCDLS
jgi:hypothetical protein